MSERQLKCVAVAPSTSSLSCRVTKAWMSCRFVLLRVRSPSESENYSWLCLPIVQVGRGVGETPMDGHCRQYSGLVLRPLLRRKSETPLPKKTTEGSMQIASGCFEDLVRRNDSMDSAHV